MKITTTYNGTTTRVESPSLAQMWSVAAMPKPYVNIVNDAVREAERRESALLLEKLFGNQAVAHKSIPPVKDVISNDVATIVFFEDNSKVVTKLHDGDSRLNYFGLVFCCLRKAMRNRTCEHMEKAVKKAIKCCKSPKELRALGKALGIAADWLEKADEA